MFYKQRCPEQWCKCFDESVLRISWIDKYFSCIRFTWQQRLWKKELFTGSAKLHPIPVKSVSFRFRIVEKGRNLPGEWQDPHCRTTKLICELYRKLKARQLHFYRYHKAACDELEVWHDMWLVSLVNQTEFETTEIHIMRLSLLNFSSTFSPESET